MCAPCWSALRFIERPFCEVSGAPFAYDIGAGALSADVIADPPPFRRARAPLAYGGGTARLVAQLKYSDRTDLAPFMARLMMRALADLSLDKDRPPILMPVPLHRWRLLARGTNQAAEIARALASLSGLRLRCDMLVRRRRTRSQVGLGRKGRSRNVAAAFAVPEGAKDALAGRDVVLVDDVLTTGATLSACVRALHRGGAANVDCITFARVVSDAEP